MDLKIGKTNPACLLTSNFERLFKFLFFKLNTINFPNASKKNTITKTDIENKITSKINVKITNAEPVKFR